MRTSYYVTAIALLMALSVALQVWRDDGWTAYEPATPVMWLQAGPAMQRAALGYDALVADIYWMRSVVYFGRQHMSDAKDKNYDLLYPMLHLVTTLDPKFSVAYRFGAFFLSEKAPDGPDRPDLGVELLKRGMEADPNRWDYPHDIGFTYFWNYRDHETAAKWFDFAGNLPGAPVWLKATAAAALQRGGDRESARMLWRQLHDTTEIDWVKESAEIRLMQLDSMDAIDALNQIVWRYEAASGRFPGSWQELIGARVLRSVPMDPTGVPFELEPVNEDVRLSQRSALWPLPQDLESSAQ